jgi:hypothetical protein
MSDLLFQNIQPTQSLQQPAPVTFTAAATIAPTTFLSYITGTTALATITPPVSGTHLLAIVAKTTNWLGVLTTGNVLVASITNGTTWQNKVSFFVYDPATAKYMPTYAVKNTTDV